MLKYKIVKNNFFRKGPGARFGAGATDFLERTKMGSLR
jgi:hypothetical protein